MNHRKFDCTYPIRILDLLAHLMNETDMLTMSEAQAFIALPIFAVEPPETKFRTTEAKRHTTMALPADQTYGRRPRRFANPLVSSFYSPRWRRSRWRVPKETESSSLPLGKCPKLGWEDHPLYLYVIWRHTDCGRTLLRKHASSRVDFRKPGVFREVRRLDILCPGTIHLAM